MPRWLVILIFLGATAPILGCIAWDAWRIVQNRREIRESRKRVAKIAEMQAQAESYFWN